MISYNKVPDSIIKTAFKDISCFTGNTDNIDAKIVKSFSEEWSKFNDFSDNDIKKMGDEYFDIITEQMLSEISIVLDIGCGTGRWSMYWCDKVKHIDATDPSEAVLAAVRLTRNKQNIRITQCDANNLPFNDDSFDLVMSVGVLHHIPDTQAALKSITQKARVNGYVYVYIYYALDNKGLIFKSIFCIVNFMRVMISKMPPLIKKVICELIAIIVYLPLITLAKSLKILFKHKLFWKKIPLSYYVDKPLYVIRNDALDRFGTSLEQRFTKKQLLEMMKNAGLEEIAVSDNQPYWHAVGRRAK
ncbi:MAG: class SAM-dependent methyltransferase [Burkholderiales bacterium]|nr:class SAM-dependent methyltransferase [Burkholderiales bacterium]